LTTPETDALPLLLGTRPAALNQNSKNDDNQNTGNNPDDKGRIHDLFLLP
jgi:hypothetical protein